jgi:hypothetical protein
MPSNVAEADLDSDFTHANIRVIAIRSLAIFSTSASLGLGIKPSISGTLIIQQLAKRPP